MNERESMKEAEAESKPVNWYEEINAMRAEENERLANAKLVIKAKDIPWEHSRQAIVRWYTHPRMKNTALPSMWVFVQDIRNHSGRHRHQGGLGLFVLEGKGYTVVDGVRHDWEKGDLILLPIKKDGCEHQHFNIVQETPTRWVQLNVPPFMLMLAWDNVQVENRPGWDEGHVG